MRLELTRVGLLVELANHYTTRGASGKSVYVPLHGLSFLIVAQRDKLVFSPFVRFFLTNAFFFVHPRHSSVNFTWFEFDVISLFKLGQSV